MGILRVSIRSVSLVGVLLFAAPASAIDSASVPDQLDVRIPLVATGPDPLRVQLEEIALRPGRLLEWLRDLKRVPLRPVRIGESPRRPDDPEPTLGVVLKLRF